MNLNSSESRAHIEAQAKGYATYALTSTLISSIAANGAVYEGLEAQSKLAEKSLHAAGEGNLRAAAVLATVAVGTAIGANATFKLHATLRGVLAADKLDSTQQ
jgi:hypothetical protein